MKSLPALVAVACFSGLLSVSLWPASAAQAAPLTGKWVEVESENFVVITNCRPKQAKQVARHFETIREVFALAMPALEKSSGPRLKIFAASNDKTMRQLLPARWENQSLARPAGLFTETPVDQLIVVNAEYLDSETFDVIYHEYFHFVVANAGIELPAWLGEGLADYWGAGAKVTPKHTEVGRPLKGRLQRIIDGRTLPLEEVLTADLSSPYYRDQRDAGSFYAQSWALTHMILLGDDRQEMHGQLTVYLGLLAEGVDLLTAAREAFGDLDKLEKKLRPYSRQFRFRVGKYPLPAAIEDGALQLRELSQPEAAAQIARYLPRMRSVGDTEELLAMANGGAKGGLATHEAQGLLHVRKEQVKDGIDAFERAAAHPESGPLGHYGVSVLRFHQARQQDALTAETLREIEQRLLRAIELDDAFAPAIVRLAEVYRRLDDGPNRALALMRRATALEPQEEEYRLLEARLLRATGAEATAAKVARDEAQAAARTDNAGRNNTICWFGALWGFADSVLPACDRAIELAPESTAILDSRGLARILAGDVSGGKADLVAALVPDSALDDRTRATREAWLTALEEGKDPFGGRGHEVLSEDFAEEGIGWLR